jgi:hypothetical protein
MSRQLVPLLFHSKRRMSCVTDRMAVPRLRQSAAVLSHSRLGFSSRLVNVGFLTKFYWLRLLPEKFGMHLAVSAHQTSIMIPHSLLPTECPFLVLPYEMPLTSFKPISQRSSFSFNFQHPLYSLTSSSCCLRLLPLLPVTYILPHFPSRTSFRRQFISKTWSFQSANPI